MKSSANNTAGAIQSRKDFDKDPSGQYKYWHIEMQSAFKRLRSWHTMGDVITKRYIDDRTGQGVGASLHGSYAGQLDGNTGRFRLNLFNSNTKTVKDMLYSKLPRVDVSRIDHTGNDDVARVAAEMIERMLRLELEENGAELDATLKSLLLDRMLAGLGTARVRYEVETEQNGENEQVKSEKAPVDYYYWGDIIWGWGRTFSALPWIGFRSFLTKDQVEKRFGQKAADGVMLRQQDTTAREDGVTDPDRSSAWMKAEIWEIWDKQRKKVVWMSIGYDKLLDTKPDTLKLKGFYPCPPFFLANPTTQLYIPTPDYHLAQDLYNTIDVLQTRIAIITEAVKVIGVYDASAEGVRRMLKEGSENDLIPVDNWALFAEKGGIQGQVDWLPLADIVGALDKLRSLRDETIGLLQQVTGMADVMRGELSNQYEGVGQTQMKAQYGSSRIQALSEDFAHFVSDLMQLKAEVICKHFSPETIVKQSNMEFSPDRDMVPQAVELLKNPARLACRVQIRPETMAQQDYAQLQGERENYLQGLSTFIQAASPLIQQDPRSTPFLLEMLKWAMAGYKGASDVEGILDQAIETMKQPQEQEKPPSAEQQKIDGQIKLEETRGQFKEREMQAKLQQEMQIREQDKAADIETRQAEHQMEQQKIQAEMRKELTIIAAKMEADTQTELLTSQINAQQADRAVDGEIRKAIATAKIKVMEVTEGKKMDMAMKLVDKEADAVENEKDRQAERDKPAPTAAK